MQHDFIYTNFIHISWQNKTIYCLTYKQKSSQWSKFEWYTLLCNLPRKRDNLRKDTILSQCPVLKANPAVYLVWIFYFYRQMGKIRVFTIAIWLFSRIKCFFQYTVNAKRSMGRCEGRSMVTTMRLLKFSISMYLYNLQNHQQLSIFRNKD
jgi:hypothetical protein